MLFDTKMFYSQQRYFMDFSSLERIYAIINAQPNLKLLQTKDKNAKIKRIFQALIMILIDRKSGEGIRGVITQRLPARKVTCLNKSLFYRMAKENLNDFTET